MLDPAAKFAEYETPAVFGRREVWLGGECVELWRRQHTRPKSFEGTYLDLRQLLEMGTLRQSAPAWLPASLARFSRYVEIYRQRVFCLIPVCRDGLVWRAVIAVDYRATHQRLRSADDHRDVRLDDLVVEMSVHAVDQYRARLAREHTDVASRRDLAVLCRHAHFVPVPPVWAPRSTLNARAAEDEADGWIVVEDLMTFPVVRRREWTHRVCAKTCLTHEMDGATLPADKRRRLWQLLDR